MFDNHIVGVGVRKVSINPENLHDLFIVIVMLIIFRTSCPPPALKNEIDCISNKKSLHV